ncbi:MAG TPA: FAD-dependent oxidoreductase, partial [Tepidisphaeraceae bacterium]|nr:FAD-dependent oxidoreductase [Tepidisphaeraceae bacterium]
MDALDADFKQGRVGLRATEFAAAKSFRIMPAGPIKPALSAEQITAADEKAALARGVMDYAIVMPAKDGSSLNTPFDRLADRYDVIVAGAGTGGSAAAAQATRLGAHVLLIEESDWIGGQMSAAAVSTMDEEGLWFQFPVRERGFYREFHESMVNFYYTRQIDPFHAYSSYPSQTEGGYEPKITRAMLYALLDDARHRTSNGKAGVLDVSPRTRVTKVRKDGEKIVGVTLETWNDKGATSRDIGCRVLIEATEYGDVLPLTGARYRVGSVTNENLKPSAMMQDNTWTAVIREYPEGIPDHLRIKSPPPNYEQYSKAYRKYKLWGAYVWGVPGKGLKGPRDWRVWVHWRGMADSDSPLTGEASEFRHTQSGVNGGNDYLMTVGRLENPSERLASEREGIYRTLSALYYFQNEGLKWAVAEDEGYDTPYNRRAMKQRDLRADLFDIAVHLPQWPYVRESRRGMGVYTLRGMDMGRFENAKHWPTSVAMGDYFMDLHRTEEELEQDLDAGSWDKGDFPKGGGPFQVPFEVFIPEKVDGLVFAEKNISQSRLVSGATRLQPITMLTGQAAGAIAALASTRGVQPRALNPIDVQRALLDAGSTLVPRWYVDVPWGTQLWRDSQLLSLYGILDRPAPIHHRNGALREQWMWGPDEAVAESEVSAAIARLADPSAPLPATNPASESKGSINRAELTRLLSAANAGWKAEIEKASIADEQRVTRREFAAVCTHILAMPR